MTGAAPLVAPGFAVFGPSVPLVGVNLSCAAGVSRLTPTTAALAFLKRSISSRKSQDSRVQPGVSARG
jgi:hypothetical protein